MRQNNQIQIKSNERKNHQSSYSPTPYSLSALLQRQSELSNKSSNNNITVNRAQYHNISMKNPSSSTTNDKKIIEGDLISSSKNTSNILNNHYYQQQQRLPQHSIYDLIQGTKSQVKSTRLGHFNSKNGNLIHKIPRKSPLPIQKSSVEQKYLPNGMFSSMNSCGRIKQNNKKGLSQQMSHTFYTKNTPNRSLSPIIKQKDYTPKMSPNTKPFYKNYSPIPARSMMIEKFKRFQINNPMMKSKTKNIGRPNYIYNNNILSHYPNNKQQLKPAVFTMNILHDNTMDKEQVMINHSHNNIMHNNINNNNNSRKEKDDMTSHDEENNDRRISNSNSNTNPSCSGNNSSNNNQEGFKSLSECKKEEQIQLQHSALNEYNEVNKVIHDKSHSNVEPISSNKIIKKIKNIYEFTHVGFDGENDKENNQDSYFIYKKFAGHDDYIYMSVCDGHGTQGHFVSGFIKEILPVDLSHHLMNKNILYDEEIHEIIIDTFLDSNDKLVNNNNIDASFSGSTCVSLIYTPERLIVPNIGDSRAVMGRCVNNKWIAIDLSRDHKPTEEDERIRIIENDGRIEPFIDDGEYVGPHRVWLKEKDVPGLAMTRSFGDMVAASVGVVSEPEIKEFDFTEDDKFMIIASDGVWEFIESTECVNMIKNYYLKNDFKGCCQYIYNESKRRWLHEEEVIDDITMIIVVFE